MLRLISASSVIFALLLLPLSALSAQSSNIRDYGSWSVECHGKDGAAPCVATQVVAQDPEAKNVVLGVIVETREAGQLPLLTFRFTNQAFRPAGAGIKIDEYEPYRAPISACDDAVCEVRAELAQEMMDKMRSGNILVFAFFLSKDEQASFPVSLNGFSQAIAALSGG